jgi:ribosomal protein L29
MSHYKTISPPNAGIAKREAYSILQRYIKDPNFQFALLLDDTVNKIINTHTEKSIMITPTEFYHAVKKFAQESPIFGGTVAYKRHPKQCKQKGIAMVKGSFLQQALIFSCRGTPTLEKHFKDVDEYIAKMGRLSYRRVPFGEDVAFQVSLYEHGVLSRKKSPQFWGIGILRIPHESSTKPSLNLDQLKKKTKELEDKIKELEELKDMLIYLDMQNALSVNPKTNELRGVKVIPRGRIRIRIKGSKGERPWKEAFYYMQQRE